MGSEAGEAGAGLSQMSLMWRRFLHWWGGELAACIPPVLRRGLSSQQLLVAVGRDRAEVFRPEQSDDAPLATLALSGVEELAAMVAGGRPWRDGDPCRVVMESHSVLHRQVTLPVEAERNLRGVLLASLERYTPLPAGEVYFDYFVSRRVPESRKLEVSLYLAPKARIDALLERLRGAGLRPDAIDVREEGADARAGGVGVNLLPAGGRRRNRRVVFLNRALAATSLLLLAAVLALPVVQKRAQVERLTEAVAAQREAVQQAERTRSEVDVRLQAMQSLQARKTSRPSAIEILTELTRLVPDDGWASQVEIRDDRVRITGDAVSGSDLVRLLTASTIFSDPRFEAPLTQNPKTNRERFVISLALTATPKVQ